jgi:hypothetical protein
MRRALCLLLTAMFAIFTMTACSLTLDDPSTVHDLRILAISTTPPELQYPVQGDFQDLLDGGGCVPDLAPLFTSGPIQLAALVADPQGGGRDLSWTWTECPQTSDERCPTDPGYIIAQGNGPPSQISTSWDIVAEALKEEQIQEGGCDGGCRPTPLLTTFADNPLGLCRFGVWLQIGLEVEGPGDGGGPIYGSKLMVFTPVPGDYPTDAGECPQGPDGGMPPHENPVLTSLQLDQQTLPVTGSVDVLAGQDYSITPVVPSNAELPYCLPNFQGGWTPLTETWLISLMTTMGNFSEEQVGAGGFGNLAGGEINYTVTWTTPEDAGVATIYSIVRDGRGGTSWFTREVDLDSTNAP